MLSFLWNEVPLLQGQFPVIPTPRPLQFQPDPVDAYKWFSMYVVRIEGRRLIVKYVISGIADDRIHHFNSTPLALNTEKHLVYCEDGLYQYAIRTRGRLIVSRYTGPYLAVQDELYAIPNAVSEF